MKNLWYIKREESSPNLPSSLSREAGALGVSVRIFVGCEPVLSCLTNDADTADTLFLTDCPEFAEKAMQQKLPTAGYEHGGVRMPCAEILLCLRNLTLAECNALFDALTGNLPLYEDDAFAFYPMDEETFLRYFNLFRAEPYFLSEETGRMEEAMVRMLWHNRRVLSSFSEGFGPAEVYRKSDLAQSKESAEPIGYVAAFTERFEDFEKPVLTMEYYLHPKVRGQRLSVRMVGSLLSALAKNCPNEPVYAKVHPANKASLAVLERLGFSDVPVARAKEYRLKVARQPAHCKP